MPLLWEAPEFVKIHENCGGFVEWREAIDTPGVGYTGHCRVCGALRIVQEFILPVELPEDEDAAEQVREQLNSLGRDGRAELAWDDEQDFDANQARLRREITGATAQQGGRA